MFSLRVFIFVISADPLCNYIEPHQHWCPTTTWCRECKCKIRWNVRSMSIWNPPPANIMSRNEFISCRDNGRRSLSTRDVRMAGFFSSALQLRTILCLPSQCLTYYPFNLSSGRYKLEMRVTHSSPGWLAGWHTIWQGLFRCLKLRVKLWHHVLRCRPRCRSGNL